jgi:hypothetical protein
MAEVYRSTESALFPHQIMASLVQKRGMDGKLAELTYRKKLAFFSS